MNGLSTVVEALLHTPSRRPPADIVTAKGKTGGLRALLRDGPATGRELSARSGLTCTIVSALLNADLRRGRVLKEGAFYSLAPDFDEEEVQRIRCAAAFLRANGYQVRKLP